MNKKNSVTKKTITVGAFALLIVGIIVGGVIAAPLWLPRSFDNSTANALKNGDYQAYMNAIEANWQKYKASITPDVFNKMSQDFINKTAERTAMQSSMKAADKAIQDNNYQEWTTAINTLNKKPAYYANITADNFATYVKLYQAEKSGDWNAVQQYSQELGIARVMHFRGRRFGWKKPW